MASVQTLFQKYVKSLHFFFFHQHFIASFSILIKYCQTWTYIYCEKNTGQRQDASQVGFYLQCNTQDKHKDWLYLRNSKHKQNMCIQHKNLTSYPRRPGTISKAKGRHCTLANYFMAPLKSKATNRQCCLRIVTSSAVELRRFFQNLGYKDKRLKLY